MFQKSDERMIPEINLIVMSDIRNDPEEFCDAKNDQANDDGKRK